MDETFGQYSFFDSQPCDNKLPHHAISCKNRNTRIFVPGSTAYWTFKLYVNYVRFTVLSFLVFHPLFLDNGSVCRSNNWDNHCPRTFSTWSSKRLARPKRPWCAAPSGRAELGPSSAGVRAHAHTTSTVWLWRLVSADDPWCGMVTSDTCYWRWWERFHLTKSWIDDDAWCVALTLITVY